MSPDLAAALALGGQAFLVGLSGAMSPGPYLTVTIARTMQRGPFSAALMLVGHAALEAVLILGFAFGLQRVLARPSVLAVLALLGQLNPAEGCKWSRGRCESAPGHASVDWSPAAAEQPGQLNGGHGHVWIARHHVYAGVLQAADGLLDSGFCLLYTSPSPRD